MSVLVGAGILPHLRGRSSVPAIQKTPIAAYILVRAGYKEDVHVFETIKKPHSFL
jgi:hypothetical protein